MCLDDAVRVEKTAAEPATSRRSRQPRGRGRLLLGRRRPGEPRASRRQSRTLSRELRWRRRGCVA
eukprot:11175077-Lingulodinium_polyedra.AAC.1